MSETKSTAYLSFSVSFECPHCGEDLNLDDENDCSLANDDVPSSVQVALRKWWANEEVGRLEGECYKCGKEFVVDEIVY